MTTSAVAASSLEPTAAKGASLSELLMLLFSRTVLFAAVQLLIALGLLIAGHTAPFAESARWWPFSVILTNGVSLWILRTLLRREGSGLWELYRPDPRHWLRDLGLAVLLSGVGGALAALPMLVVGAWLFGNNAVPTAMMYQPLSVGWVIVAAMLFPITQGLAELPTYGGYIMPRLKAHSGQWWSAILITGFWLGAQHVAVPFLLDGRFILWRLLMFQLFAVFTCGMLAWKPRLLPYFMFVHILMDFQAALMLLP